jgi:hypothetical protein
VVVTGDDKDKYQGRSAARKKCIKLCALTHGSNENKMSDGGRGRVSLAVKVWKSSQEWSAQRSVVRSIAWLDRIMSLEATAQRKETFLDDAVARGASATVAR